MKKHFLFIAIIAFTILVVASVSAREIREDRIQFTQITLLNDFLAEDEDFLLVTVDNNQQFTLKDTRITVTIPDLGVRGSSGPFKFRSRDSVTKLIQLEGTEDALYPYARVVVSNDEFRRVKHIPLFLE